MHLHICIRIHNMYIAVHIIETTRHTFKKIKQLFIDAAFFKPLTALLRLIKLTAVVSMQRENLTT